MKNLFYFFSAFLLCGLLTSCEKDLQNDLSESSQTDQSGPNVQLDPSYLDTELSYEQATELGFEFEESTFDQLRVVICDVPESRSSNAGLSCGTSASREESCCSTDSEACVGPGIPTNSSFRISGCFDWIFEATNHRLFRRWSINGQVVAGGSTSIAIARGCNFYDPQAFYINGEIAGYLCIGPSGLGDCPATVTVESWWRYYFPANNTYGQCGYNSKNYNYPGNPFICDDQ